MILELPLNLQIFGDFIKSFRYWLNKEYLKSFTMHEEVMTTYDKGIQLYNFIKKEKLYEKRKPYCVINVDMNMENVSRDDEIPWKYPDITDYGKFMEEPLIYNDDFRISPVFRTRSFNISVKIMVDTLYELLNLKGNLMSKSSIGNFHVNTFPKLLYKLICPSKLITEPYKNDELGIYRDDYINDIKFAEETYISYMGSDNKKLCFYMKNDPLITIESINDESNHSPSEDIKVFSLGVNFKCELRMPVFLVMDSNIKIKDHKIFMDTSYTSQLNFEEMDGIYPSNNILKFADENDIIRIYKIKNNYSGRGKDFYNKEMGHFIKLYNYEDNDIFLIYSKATRKKFIINSSMTEGYIANDKYLVLDELLVIENDKEYQIIQCQEES